MATILEMPKLSDTMTTGKIISWLKKEGDLVKAGSALAEVETDKATMELESFEDGVLLKILAPADSAVPIGGPIAIIGKPGENIEAMTRRALEKTTAAPHGSAAEPSTRSETPAASAVIATAQAMESAKVPPSEGSEGRLRVSPVAQRMAAEHNLDLRRVKGSGPSGRIVKRDIEGLLSAAPAAEPFSGPPVPQAPYEDIPLSSIRSVIAQRLPQSLGPVPHFYLEIDIDAEPLVNMKEQLRGFELETKITLTDVVVKACAIALRRHPEINSSYNGASVRRYHGVNIGVAVAGQGTLLVPVIRACETKSIGQVARDRAFLVEKAQKGKLAGEEMAGGTFTLSNLGMMGITRFCAVINPPQAAILAVGTIRNEPVVKNGAVVPGKRMALTLSCDHRAFDGAEGANFMATLKQILENPLALSL